MIVSSEGCAVKTKSVAEGSATMIVSTSGVAYRKTTKIKAVLRFLKKSIAPLVKYKETFVDKVFYERTWCTKSGKPSSVEPPASTRQKHFYI
jgi:hypothetical protein